MDGVYRDLTWLRPRTRLFGVWGLVSVAWELKKLDMMQRRTIHMLMKGCILCDEQKKRISGIYKPQKVVYINKNIKICN